MGNFKAKAGDNHIQILAHLYHYFHLFSNKIDNLDIISNNLKSLDLSCYIQGVLLE